MSNWEERAYRITEVAGLLNVSTDHVLHATKALELRLRRSPKAEDYGESMVSANDALKIEKHLKDVSKALKKQLKRNAITDQNVPSPIPLTGVELLAKLAEIGNVSKSEQVRACGYLSKRQNPEKPEKLNFTDFHKALEEARGKSNPQTLWKSKGRLTGNELSSKVDKIKGAKTEHIARSCGYISKNADGSERIDYQEFFDALRNAGCKVKFSETRQNERKDAPKEKTSLSNKDLDQLRHRQRALAQGRRDKSIPIQQNIDNNRILVGTLLLNFCIDEYEARSAETSICIRAGYKTDNIGQFRRAFSKAADVPFGPLARMIADLKRKEAQVKERAKKHLDDQGKILTEESSRSEEEESEKLIAERRTVEVRSTTRIRNTRFRNAVLKAHGYKCACCGIDIPDLLEAAHIVPVANDGTDHPSNGIALCPTHHSAFDRHYFTFEPGSRKLILKEGKTKNELRITRGLVEADVNDECLALRQRLFNKEARD